MICPLLRPFISSDCPDNGIIFHTIAQILLQGRKRRAQIAQYTSLIEVTQRRIQGIEHRGNYTFLQDILCARLIQRDSHPVKYHIHQRQVRCHISADHRNIPIAVPISHKLQNLLRSSQTFLPRGFAAVCAHTVPNAAVGYTSLKQLFPHRCQGMFFCFNNFDFHRHTGTLGTV